MDGRPGVPGRPSTSTVIRPRTWRSSWPAPGTSVTSTLKTIVPCTLPRRADSVTIGPDARALSADPLNCLTLSAVIVAPWIGVWTYWRRSTVRLAPALRPRTVIAATVGGGASITRTLRVAVAFEPATPILSVPVVPGRACAPGVIVTVELLSLTSDTPGGCFAQLEVKSSWSILLGSSSHTWQTLARSILSGAPPCTAVSIEAGQRSTGCGVPTCTGSAITACCARGSDRLVPSVTSNTAAAGPWYCLRAVSRSVVWFLLATARPFGGEPQMWSVVVSRTGLPAGSTT